MAPNPYDTLGKSPMFKLSLSSKELFHSNYLQYLSTIDPDAFRRMINKMAGLDENHAWPDVWRVKREYNNFDLCVVAYEPNRYTDPQDEKIDDDDDFHILFVLENKVKSIPYLYQLKKYSEEAQAINEHYWKLQAKKQINKDWDKLIVVNNCWVKRKKDGKQGRRNIWKDTKTNFQGVDSSVPNGITSFASWYSDKEIKANPIHFILLTFAQDFPEKSEIERIWTVFSYKDLPSLIRKHFLPQGITNHTDLSEMLAENYCVFVDSLVQLSNKWADDYQDPCSPFLYFDMDDSGKRQFHDDYIKARRLRIHDLYQKLKFSYLCTVLYNETVQKKWNNWTIFLNNQDGLNKNGKNLAWGPNQTYLCVNYNYLHGEPLLELHVHPKQNKKARNEILYVIQIQGEAYEHGLIVKAKGNKGKAKTITAATAWNKLQQNQIKIIDDWIDVPSANKSWQNPAPSFLDSINNRNPYNQYNANDSTYLYQSRSIIKTDVSSRTIINLMLNDLLHVINSV